MLIYCKYRDSADNMKLIALTIGGQGSPQYNIGLPSQIGSIAGLHLQNIVSFAILLLLSVAILLSFFFMLFGGLKWIISQGDKKQVEEAQKTITFSIIGLVITLLSFFILNILGYLFQVPLIGN